MVEQGLAAVRRTPIPRLLQPLQQGQYALLWTGQTISTLGDLAYGTVLIWAVYAIGGSAADAGYVLVSESVPQLILLLAGGVVGDRFSRRLVILVADALAGASVGIVAILAATGHLTVPVLIVLSAIFGTLGAFFLPAYQPLIPEIVPEDRLQAVNAFQAVTLNTSQVVGPALGAGLYALGRATAAFGFDALTYFVAAAASLFLRVPNRPVRLKSSLWSDIRGGWSYIRRTTWLWLSMILSNASYLVATAPFFVLLPAILRNLHLGVGYMGVTLSLLGIAGMAGNILLAQLHPLHHRGLFVYAGWSLLGIAYVLVGIAPAYPVIALAALLIGVGLTVNTVWVTLIQQIVPTQYQSRVSSLIAVGAFGLRPLGFAGAGIVASAVGARPILIVGGIITFALFTLGALVPAIRHLD